MKIPFLRRVNEIEAVNHVFEKCIDELRRYENPSGYWRLRNIQAYLDQDSIRVFGTFSRKDNTKKEEVKEKTISLEYHIQEGRIMGREGYISHKREHRREGKMIMDVGEKPRKVVA